MLSSMALEPSSHRKDGLRIFIFWTRLDDGQVIDPVRVLRAIDDLKQASATSNPRWPLSADGAVYVKEAN